tara:strand:- start:78694 stop:78816 length:123 start_codon:yes stop_codon:yes gene_type:complete
MIFFDKNKYKVTENKNTKKTDKIFVGFLVWIGIKRIKLFV